MKHVLAVAALALSLLSSCSQAPDQSAASPTEVAERLLVAIRDEDQAGFEELLTARAREGAGSGEGFQLSGAELGAWQLGAPEVTGDRADVPVTMQVQGEEQALSIGMRREDGAWRAFAFTMRMSEGAEFTVDLEQLDKVVDAFTEELANEFAAGLEDAFADAEAAWANGGTAEEIARARRGFEDIDELTTSDLETDWQVDVVCQGTPAAELVEVLIAGSGWKVEAGAHAEALGREVDLDVRGVSRLQALALVAEAVGLRPVLPALDVAYFGEAPQPVLSFEAGPAELPVAFVGPYQVEVRAVEENAPHGTGTLTVAARTLGLPPAALAFQDEMREHMRFEAVLDARGGSLVADEDTTYWGTPSIQGDYSEYSLQIDLRLLLRSVEEIDRVSGRLFLPVPTGVHAFSWTPGEARPKTVGGMEIALEEWGESTRFAISNVEDAESVVVRLSALDASEAPLGTLYNDSSAWDGTVKASIQTPQAPARVDVKVCRVETIELPFELRGVALKHFADMPERLEELEFRGAAPVQVDFGRFLSQEDMPQVSITVRNGSNKDIQDVVATFFYLDARGAELEDFPHTLTGEFSFEGQAPLAPAGATVSSETTAFFVPEGVTDVRIRVDSASFFDGTSWSRED